MKTILRRPAVLAKTGLSASTIYRLEKAGRFPARVQLGPGSVGWIEEEVDAWVQQRRRAGDGAQLSPKKAMFHSILRSWNEAMGDFWSRGESKPSEP